MFNGGRAVVLDNHLGERIYTFTFWAERRNQGTHDLCQRGSIIDLQRKAGGKPQHVIMCHIYFVRHQVHPQ